MKQGSAIHVKREAAKTPEQAIEHARAGRPLTIDEICLVTGQSKCAVAKTIKTARRKIKAAFDERGLATTALEAMLK